MIRALSTSSGLCRKSGRATRAAADDADDPGGALRATYRVQFTREFGFDETVIRIGEPKRHLPSRRSGTMATCDRGSMRPSLRSISYAQMRSL